MHVVSHSLSESLVSRVVTVPRHLRDHFNRFPVVPTFGHFYKSLCTGAMLRMHALARDRRILRCLQSGVILKAVIGDQAGFKVLCTRRRAAVSGWTLLRCMRRSLLLLAYTVTWDIQSQVQKFQRSYDSKLKFDGCTQFTLQTFDCMKRSELIDTGPVAVGLFQIKNCNNSVWISGASEVIFIEQPRLTKVVSITTSSSILGS
jgi:hypothetical protein